MAKKKPLYLEVVTDEPEKVLKTLADAGYTATIRRWSEDVAELFKALVRPFTIFVFVPLIAIMTYQGRFDQIPLVILIAGGVVSGEYWIERAKKRFQGT